MSTGFPNYPEYINELKVNLRVLSYDRSRYITSNGTNLELNLFQFFKDMGVDMYDRETAYLIYKSDSNSQNYVDPVDNVLKDNYYLNSALLIPRQKLSQYSNVIFSDRGRIQPPIMFRDDSLNFSWVGNCQSWTNPVGLGTSYLNLPEVPTLANEMLILDDTTNRLFHSFVSFKYSSRDQVDIKEVLDLLALRGSARYNRYFSILPFASIAYTELLHTLGATPSPPHTLLGAEHTDVNQSGPIEENHVLTYSAGNWSHAFVDYADVTNAPNIDGSNQGAGDGQPFIQKTGDTLEFRTISGSGGVTITNNADTIDIFAPNAAQDTVLGFRYQYETGGGVPSGNGKWTYNETTDTFSISKYDLDSVNRNQQLVELGFYGAFIFHAGDPTSNKYFELPRQQAVRTDQGTYYSFTPTINLVFGFTNIVDGDIMYLTINNQYLHELNHLTDVKLETFNPSLSDYDGITTDLPIPVTRYKNSELTDFLTWSDELNPSFSKVADVNVPPLTQIGVNNYNAVNLPTSNDFISYETVPINSADNTGFSYCIVLQDLAVLSLAVAGIVNFSRDFSTGVAPDSLVGVYLDGVGGITGFNAVGGLVSNLAQSLVNISSGQVCVVHYNYNNSTGLINIYVNGVFFGSFTSTTSPLTNLKYFNIGAFWSGQNGVGLKVGEFIVWNELLTGSKILDVSNKLIAYFNTPIIGPPVDTNILKYRADISSWVASGNTLSGLEDTQISPPQNNQTLVYSGGNWINSNLNYSSLTGQPRFYKVNYSISPFPPSISFPVVDGVMSFFNNILYLSTKDQYGNLISGLDSMLTGYRCGITFISGLVEASQANFIVEKMTLDNTTAPPYEWWYGTAFNIGNSNITTVNNGYIIIRPPNDLPSSRVGHPYKWTNAVGASSGEITVSGGNISINNTDAENNDLTAMLSGGGVSKNVVYTWYARDDPSKFMYGRITPADLTPVGSAYNGAFSGGVFGTPNEGEYGYLIIQPANQETLGEINDVDLGLINLDGGQSLVYAGGSWQNKYKYSLIGSNPTVTNDETENYEIGSRWLNTNDGKSFVCLDPTTGAAVWREIIDADNSQKLNNKQLVDESVTFIDNLDSSKILKFQASTITTGTTRTVEAHNESGRMMLSTSGESVKFDNNSGGDQVFALNGGLGNTVGDRITCVRNSNYPFFSGVTWSNLSLVTGAISFEDYNNPLIITDTPTPLSNYVLIPFAGVLQAGSFQVTTNGSGRLINNDGITWTFLINWSCALTGSNGTEWEVALHINGVKVSNSYITTVASAGRYASLTGVWYQPLNGSSVGGTAVPNQYAEIYIKRNQGSGSVTIGSAFLSILAVRMLPQPTV